MEAACGVDEEDVDGASLGGGEGVEESCGGIATLTGLDEVDVGTLRPDFQLLDGGGAEGVGGAEEDGAAFAPVESCRCR